MNASHNRPEVPAHRVVNAMDCWSTSFQVQIDATTSWKWGLSVKNDQIIDFNDFFGTNTTSTIEI